MVLVLGCELSVFGTGFIPGADSYARLSALLAPPPELLAGYETIVRQLNEFLAAAAANARRSFAGPVSYAAAPWEPVDWEPFDIVGSDAYRDASNAARCRAQIRDLTRHGKPAAVTEFGCGTFRGAADRGASGWMIVSGTGSQRRLDGTYLRDEHEQARYLRELLALYEDEGIDTAFWFTFARYDKPRRTDPRLDLDLASYGVVAILEPDSGRATGAQVPQGGVRRARRPPAPIAGHGPAMISIVMVEV